MNNFTQRAITGVFFVAAICGLTLYNEFSFLVLLCAICLFGMKEYYTIVFQGQLNYAHALFMGIGLGVVCLKYWLDDWVVNALPLLFPMAAFTVLLSKNREWKRLAYFTLLCLCFFFMQAPFNWSLCKNRLKQYTCPCWP